MSLVLRRTKRDITQAPELCKCLFTLGFLRVLLKHLQAVLCEKTYIHVFWMGGKAHIYRERKSTFSLRFYPLAARDVSESCLLVIVSAAAVLAVRTK
jgi:hypothetical protein